MLLNSNQVYIIAEAGVNHNGSLSRALELIEIAAEAGADCVKFQTFSADRVISPTAPKAEYQKQHTDGDSQWEMVKKLELELSDYPKLVRRCEELQIQFLSSPFDSGSLRFLVEQLQVSALKIGSGEITNAELLLGAGRSQKPVILSTGMCNMEEVQIALGILAFGYLASNEMPSVGVFKKAFASVEGQRVLKANVVLLHCVSEYPAPFAEVNLKAMDSLKDQFGLAVGYSDHTSGIEVPIAAVARGAKIIEKHFTSDRNLPGPDHKASLVAAELGAMVRAIRHTELALGDGIKRAAPSEEKNKSVVRKSLFALKAIQKGEAFTSENLTVLRPGDGISALYYWDYLGKTAGRDYAAGEAI